MKNKGLLSYLFLSHHGHDDLIINFENDDTKIHYMKIYFDLVDSNHLLIDMRLSDVFYSDEELEISENFGNKFSFLCNDMV